MKRLVLLLSIAVAYTWGQNPEALTNDTIIKMAKAGVSENVILQTINAAESVSFRFLPGDLVALTQVSNEVVRAMQLRQQRPATLPKTPAARTPKSVDQPPEGPRISAANKYAPLPEKLVAAKTAFIENETGEQGFTDAVFKELKEWGRWRIVTDRADSDIVIALDHKDRLHNYFYLRVLDRQSGEVLWTAKKDAAIRIWSRVARILVEDLRKRFPPNSGSNEANWRGSQAQGLEQSQHAAN